jgi:hypothetical protein
MHSNLAAKRWLELRVVGGRSAHVMAESRQQILKCLEAMYVLMRVPVVY